jgi:hypothetical protein
MQIWFKGIKTMWPVYFLAGWLVLFFGVLGCGADVDHKRAAAMAGKEHASQIRTTLDRTGTLWHPHLEWRLENADYRGNPYDLMASVTFTHQESGSKHLTWMYYDGTGAWRFRFTATQIGVWTFTTRSHARNLNGHGGTITIEPNPDPAIKGFLLTAGTKFARQVGAAGELEAFIFNVYQDNLDFPADYANRQKGVRLDYVSRYPPEAWATAYLQRAREHGADALFMALAHQWLQVGALTYEEHASRNPDPLTFEMLEQVITTVHAQGGHLHIWMWGDEERKWTPIGLPGGINGEVDLRLQRYIAARLGPLPGWSISYGFDLHEWVLRREVGMWGAYLHLHLGWPRIVAAREESHFRTPDNMDVYSNDARPSGEFYETALNAFENSGGRPVLFERRFLHGRDGIWTAENTRRAMWQFTMAGGAGALWGVHPGLGTGPYPDPQPLATHRRFWQGRFLLNMQPANDLTDGYALQDITNPGRAIFYREDASTIRMDLTGMPGNQPAIAIDTRLPYAQIQIEPLAPIRHTWQAPYMSDWAIAIGTY